MASSAGRRAAIGEMFSAIEARWGSMSSLTERVGIERNSRYLSEESLKRLVNHECLAIVVENYVDSSLSKRLGEAIEGLDQQYNWSTTTRGLESTDVASALGLPFNVAVGSGRVEEYCRGVPDATKKLRELSGGFASPLDRLRTDLDDAWPQGCSVKRERGRPMHSGLARVMRGPTRWDKGFVHVDELAPLSSTQGLFSANVYLDLPRPEDGGHLELWPVAFRNRWQFYANAPTLSALTVQDRDAQMRLREKLPDPLVVKPRPGDLVLLCVQRPHAVAGFAQGKRVSLQSFITHQGPDRPLLLEN